MGSVQCVLSAVPAGETRGGFNERALPIERSALMPSAVPREPTANVPAFSIFYGLSSGSSWRARVARLRGLNRSPYPYLHRKKKTRQTLGIPTLEFPLTVRLCHPCTHEPAHFSQSAVPQF